MRVGVAGALGRMGRLACAALASADGLELVGGFARAHAGERLGEILSLVEPGGRLYDDVTEFYDDAKPAVVVDFTLYPATLDVAREAVDRGISPVIGTTGWTDEDLVSFEDLCDERQTGAALVPNFALGAAFAMRFAEQAARAFPTVEIVEMHHERKVDRPSGTAKLTAQRIAAASGRDDVPVHSVRLRGVVAHQDVLFGGEDELLTIRHDAFSRGAFMPGVLLAVRGVAQQRKLVVGLEPFLNLPA